MFFLQDALTPSLMCLVTGTSHLIPQNTKITCKGMGEDAANLFQQSLSLTPLTLTLPHMLSSLFGEGAGAVFFCIPVQGE